MKVNTTFTKALDKIVKFANKRRSEIRENQVKEFVSEAELHPFIQPIFNSCGEELIGCEVLLRFKTKEGFTSPVSYIQYLESSEYMNKITIKLLNDVSGYFLRKNIHLPDDFYFSFNIFAPQLGSEELIQELQTFSDKFTGKASLVLEIVERGILKLDEETMDTMERLMRKNIRFAIDDFGAGASSLKYVEHVGFSTIKIDRELTLSSGNALIYQKVIDAIVTLANQLGLSVTAEGVENPVQLELLHNAGVNAMQGYYLAKPMEMTKFIKAYF